MESVGFDPDDVTSPSFALVNLYNADAVDVYHIDLWRIDEGADAAFGVGLDEIVGEPNSIVIIEWAERLGAFRFPGRVWKVEIGGAGEATREIEISLNDTHSEVDAAG